MDVAGIALLVSIALAFVLLARQRSRTRFEDDQPKEPAPGPGSKRQRRILQMSEPPPEIPSIMDLVREEIEETGVENLPGSEGLAGPVMLKVYRRDQPVRDRCTHDAYGFVVNAGVEPSEATEDEVVLFCSDCGDEAPPEDSGTDQPE